MSDFLKNVNENSLISCSDKYCTFIISGSDFKRILNEHYLSIPVLENDNGSLDFGCPTCGKFLEIINDDDGDSFSKLSFIN